MYAVGSEEEARKLLVMACSTNMEGEFIARELTEEQTISSLVVFSRRLHDLHEKYLRGKKHCCCQEIT